MESRRVIRVYVQASLGFRIRGTLGDIDPLNKVPFSLNPKPGYKEQGCEGLYAATAGLSKLMASLSAAFWGCCQLRIAGI